MKNFESLQWDLEIALSEMRQGHIVPNVSLTLSAENARRVTGTLEDCYNLISRVVESTKQTKKKTKKKST